MVAQQERKPNIIFVLIDDLGSAWLPPYARNLQPEDLEKVIVDAYRNNHKEENMDVEKHLNAARNSMPFVDQLSKEGVKFNKCFTTSALCAPSRAGILTARYSQKWGGSTIPEILGSGIPTDYQILPQLFQKNGYNTGLIGKWHVAERDESIKDIVDKKHYMSSSAKGQHPLDKGFDYYYGYNLSNSTYLAPSDLWENRSIVPAFTENDFLTDIFNEKAKLFVENALTEEKPFFLFYSPMTIHGGLTACPSKYRNQFDTGIWYTDNFAGHLLALDRGIEDIYNLLKKEGQAENTLFILCSDNGGVAPVPPYNAPYKGGKGTGWLGGSHAPLIITMPGKTRIGFEESLVSTMDILPTTLDIAGLKIPEGLDGISLKGILFEDDQKDTHDFLFSSGLHSSRWSFSYYDGRRKKYMDNEECPLYAWIINDKYYSLNTTKVIPNLYENLQQGFHAQNLIFDYTLDPLNKNILNEKGKEFSLLNKLGLWLQENRNFDRKNDYPSLINQIKQYTAFS